MATARAALALFDGLKQGMLEFWLKNDRLTGRLSLFKQPKQLAAEANPLANTV